MLNELYELSLSLEKAGIAPTEWHPDLKELPKIHKTKPCFKVYLAPDGTITEIELIEDGARIEGLRKWQSGGNGYSFPCFNVRPLFKAYSGNRATDEEKKRFDQWLKGVKKSQQLNDESKLVLEGYVRDSNKLWNDDQNKRIAECLGKIPSQLNEMIGDPPEEYRAISALIERCRKTTAEKFFGQLAKMLQEQVRKNPNVCDKYAGLLLYCGRKDPTNDIPIVLELADGLSAFSLPAANSRIHRWLNQRLLAIKNEVATDSPASDERTDAFGFTNTDWEDKLAEVNVPVLGGVKLRAMNPESPCQMRYQRIDATSFVVGKEVRKRVKGALEWLRGANPKEQEERNGKTWGNVSSAANDKEILFAYPSEIPEAPVAAVAMFGGAAANSAMQTARFVDYAEDVIKSLRTIRRPLKEVQMRVFALRKMDKARTQVSYDRHYTAERLIAAAAEWEASCVNVPAIQVRQWGKEKGAKPEWGALEVPFPLEVIWCLNTSWTQKADEPARVREFSSADGIGLLLDEGVRLRPLIERALHASIRNGGSLLIAMAHAQHQYDIHKVNRKYEKQKLLLPAILGLLLAKLGRKKEEYMKSATYLIGRMLSLADQLHYKYCQKVRDGKNPSQLVGNSLMATALEEPEQALALYAQRILPYQAWARTVSGDDSIAKSARFLLRELGRVCDEGDLRTVPGRCSDADKAQMILGYLAWDGQSDVNETEHQVRSNL